MKFTIFPNAKAQKGSVCTSELFHSYASSQKVLSLCNQIAREEDREKRSILKKELPAVTWQACFDGRRVNREAQPSGLFMLDVDHVENPFKLWESFCARREELGIVFCGKTASTKGLRIVAKCRPEFSTLVECQQWLAKEIGLEEFDESCKDWARCSFLVHESYTYYIDGSLFTDEPAEDCVYKVEQQPAPPQPTAKVNKPVQTEIDIDQREGLFDVPQDYKGIPYEEIIKEWFEQNGGEPVPGDRNSKLYKLAMRLRYITDFNAQTIFRIIPRYGLDEAEVRQLVNSACSAGRAGEMPGDLKGVIHSIEQRRNLLDTPEGEEMSEITTRSVKMPSLPPVFRQFNEVAPFDFKEAVVLAQLPILGCLGSRLRAQYLDGRMHSPSFQVSLEAPQASGKSFLGRLVEYELGAVIEHDELEREKERDYQSKIQELKVLNVKITPENKKEILGTRPESVIRYVPATMSITKLLMRMQAAGGLHLFAFAPEIDTVLKAFKRGFSSFSDALRISFDNDMYGQDYASDNSFSGNVRLYYNCLFSGTPKAMRRFYPDVEDGLVSRVLFVCLPDQFGKKMPIWGKFTDKQKSIVDIHLTRLNEVTIQGDEPQPEHIMKLGFVNEALEKWIVEQQAQAVRDKDRTRDVFCRRAAVVGFRASMLAFFLWGERNTPAIRKNTVDFAIYVANSMLTQHLLRFNVSTRDSNVNHWDDIYELLPSTFGRKDLEKLLKERNISTEARKILYKWRLLGIIQKEDKGNDTGYSVYTKCDNILTPQRKK